MGILKFGRMRATIDGAINVLMFLGLSVPKLFQNSIC